MSDRDDGRRRNRSDDDCCPGDLAVELEEECQRLRAEVARLRDFVADVRALRVEIRGGGREAWRRLGEALAALDGVPLHKVP